MSDDKRIAEIHNIVTELRTVVIGDSNGRGGLVSRVEKIEAASENQSKLITWAGSGIGALSGWAAFKDHIKHFFQQ